jgi:hypothetical protein
MLHAHKKKPEIMEFFFCNDDIKRYVKGTRPKWVQSRPDIPSIWLVKIGTNLSTKEILDLETLESPHEFPKTRLGKSIRRNNNAPTTKHANNCASSHLEGSDL